MSHKNQKKKKKETEIEKKHEKEKIHDRRQVVFQVIVFLLNLLLLSYR